MFDTCESSRDPPFIIQIICISNPLHPVLFPLCVAVSTGNQEIAPLHPQINASEPDNLRTWSAASVVQIPTTRERHGQMLRCLAVHDSYAATDHTMAVEAKLDVKCEWLRFWVGLHLFCFMGAERNARTVRRNGAKFLGEFII